MSQDTSTSRDVELFEAGDRETLEHRWQDIQSKFVDEPRSAVGEANELVGDLMDRLVSRFDEERKQLETNWDRGGDDEVTTEHLRLALQRYRSFFGRLLDARGE